jgi:hypothetical protein
MNHVARRHPFAIGLILLILSPYLIALAAAFVIVFLIAAVIETVGRR